MISVPFNVPINDDNILEIDERFNLTIMRNSLPGRVTSGIYHNATILIEDNDG